MSDDESFQAALVALDANVRRRANAKAMTLAEAASMARSHLYDILAGRKRVGIDVLCRLADALEMVLSRSSPREQKPSATGDGRWAPRSGQI